VSRARVAALSLMALTLVAIVFFSRLTASHDSQPSPATGSVAAPEAAYESTTATTEELIAFWRARVERNPRDYISYAELGGAFLRQARETGDVGSYSRAEASVEQALGLNPKYETALSYLAAVLYAQHDFAGALGRAERVYALNPGSAQALAVIGDASLELGRYDEAGSAYDKLLELSRTPPVFSRLARLAELKGQPHKAVELLTGAASEADAAVGSPESRAWYRLQLGNLYFNTGDLESAKTQYDLSLDAFPDYVHALAALGRIHTARAEYDEAIAFYQQVVARQPVAEYVIALGDTYQAAGRVADAQRQFDLVDAINALYEANGINTELSMALYLADHDTRVADAVAAARAVYQKQPGSIYAADVLAWSLYKVGRPEKALPYSQEALRLGTQDALILFHASMVNRELGNTEEARGLLAQALEINPHFSVLYAKQAAAALDELSALVRN